jgi:tetratricopeptide (TPR) repeat protein
MRSHVFNDRRLLKHAGQFVWLSIDTEKGRNEDFVAKFPVQAWPTLFIIDSQTQSVALKWIGSADVTELEQLLTDGEQAIRGSGDALKNKLAEADRLFGQGKSREAANAYGVSLEQAPADWPERSRAIQSLVFALQAAQETRACAETSAKYIPSLPKDSSFANVAATGLTCALVAPRSESWRTSAIGGLEPFNQQALQIPGLLADDRSGIYEALINAREVNNDSAGARALARQWTQFLEGEAAKAPTPEARAAYDSHRLVAAIKMGEPGRVIPVLQASELNLPDDYNPPARLAVAYRELGRYADALGAVNRALAKSYGPRKLRIFEIKVSILARTGDVAGTRATLEEALKFSDTLPTQQVPKSLVTKLRTDLEKIERI